MAAADLARGEDAQAGKAALAGAAVDGLREGERLEGVCGQPPASSATELGARSARATLGGRPITPARAGIVNSLSGSYTLIVLLMATT